jgi:retron-type reverse transcriptase
MKDAIWFIEGDIKSYFPSVNHSILMELVQKRVTDPMICDLIRKGLKAKVFTQGNGHYTPELGTPQGGILSPLLSNVYLHEFDIYINSIMEEYAKTSAKPRRNSAIEKYYKNKQKSEIYRLRIPYYDPKDKNNLRVKYVRYADDFLVGVTGGREMAEKLRDKIAE